MRCFAALVAFPFLCAVATAQTAEQNPSLIGERNVAGRLNFFSIEKEIAMGRQLSIEVEKQARVVDDPTLSEYISRLGQRIGRNSDVQFPLNVRLIESEEINAFTLPGGYIFVTTGLFKLSDNEAELASAIAHEIGHAAARHATRIASRSQIVNTGTVPLIFLGVPGGLLHEAASFLIPASLMKISREYESEADLLGLQYLWKAGYDPNATVDLLERVESTEARQPGRVARLFRAHPSTPDRLNKTQGQIQKLLPARGEYVLNTSEYETVRERLNALTAKPKPSSEDAGPPTLRRSNIQP